MPHSLKVITTVGLLFISTIALPHAIAETETEGAVELQIESAITLVDSPAPSFDTTLPPPTEKQLADLGLAQPNKAQVLSITASDGQKLHVNLYSHAGNRSVLLLHGVASSSYTYNIMAGKLRDALKANVFALDFRGHGQSGGVAGDVDYQNQYAEDIEDILQFMKHQAPQNKVIIAGHSMGGGIALMHASLPTHSSVDGYVLFAPNLGVSAPTMKTPEPTTENAPESFLKLHIPRIIGLYQLNQLGINSHDHLPVMFFNMPSQFGTNQYSYRAMLSTSPENYKTALDALKAPVITLVGSADEAFNAQAFPEVMKPMRNSEVHIIAQQTHNGIRHSQTAMQYIRTWAETNSLLDGNK
jgi:pimeloyl-ACP methyl ester carboxylesterase